MKRLLFLCVLLHACASKPTQPEPPSLARLLDIQNVSDEKLADCIERCSAEDAELARVLRESMRLQKAHARGEAVPNEELQAVVKRMNEAADAWYNKNKSSKNPSEVVAAYQLALMVRGGNARDISDLSEGLASLPARFPNEPRAHYLFGEMLERENGAPEDVLRSYLRCLALAPADKLCSSGYERVASRYERTDCPGSSLDPSFGFFLSASARDAKHPVKLGGQKAPVYVESRARVTAADVERVWVNPAGPGGEEFDQIQLELNGAGQAKLASVTREHLREKLAIAVKGKALLNATIFSPIADGRAVITMGAAPGAEKDAESVFRLLCRKPRHRTLPAQLKR